MFKFYLPLYEDEKINNYKEFDIKIDEKEDVPKIPGIEMQHQKLISNFMRGVTNVESLLLVHSMGTGKSCTAIHSIEKNLQDGIYGMKHAIILNRGKAIMNNFINELVNKCTLSYNIGNEKTQKNLWSKYYSFDTFEIFSKKISTMSDETIKKKYNNTFLVIDEVHNMLNEKSDIYTGISRFISLLPNKKILLLSGTPVRDSAEDFVPIINLLLNDKDKINIKTFKDEYYDSNKNLNEKFKNLIFNKVSYLETSKSDVYIENVGKKILDLKKFNVVEHTMSKHQTKYYLEAFNKDKDREKGVYNNSRQASRFVFPDGTYGNEGYKKYIDEKSFKVKNKIFINKIRIHYKVYFGS